ncbi:hypothetical protein M409DRAFT_56682 [Zasmidium cellare ATCC 36951]|uniref:Uncharacterized protein n=1 Tax=Zasmidium cellare ATCC 36951 TaxID=1080233 RepID=A0A6A6CBJ0_ZASCE|nr:uncharacterized protein M409DRAFT_56682 [Zasmidium cellare ATCC 36951]KAF2164415.1 hypothetical protein M409DRAFT_56682 [Zasmidium cellare ATCC 36951]
MHFHALFAALTSLLAFAAAQGCPTITIHDHGGCKGCTKTVDMVTSTQLIDCGGCTSIATMTDREPFLNCKVPCRGGFKTEYNAEGTTTVTSCSASPTQGLRMRSEWVG